MNRIDPNEGFPVHSRIWQTDATGRTIASIEIVQTRWSPKSLYSMICDDRCPTCEQLVCECDASAQEPGRE